MESILVNEILSWTKAKLLLGKKEDRITYFSTDSRTINRNDFFIPITGENYDGGDFIIETVRKGAGGFVYGKNQKDINDILKLIKTDYPGVVVLECDNTCLLYT